MHQSKPCCSPAISISQAYFATPYGSIGLGICSSLKYPLPCPYTAKDDVKTNLSILYLMQLFIIFVVDIRLLS